MADRDGTGPGSDAGVVVPEEAQAVAGSVPGSPAPRPPEVFEPGEVVAEQFEVVRLVGRGGMGLVYEVRDRLSGQRLALKCIHPRHVENPHALRRFVEEVNLARKLRHPNIVAVYDVGQHGAIPYFTMEYLEGKSLWKVMKERGPMALDEALGYLLPLCEALEYAHKHMVHRDLSPGNVMVLPDGTVKLLDFGLARAADRATLTATGVALGKAHYMAPEQRQDAAHVDARADIYALGVMLFEMLTGQLPLGYQRLTDLRPDVPANLDQVLARCLCQDALRFGDAAALKTALFPFRVDQVASLVATGGDGPRESTGIPAALAEAHSGIGASEETEVCAPRRELEQGERRGRHRRYSALLWIGASAVLGVVAVVVLTSLGYRKGQSGTPPSLQEATRVDAPAPGAVSPMEEVDTSDVIELNAPSTAAASPLDQPGADVVAFRGKLWTIRAGTICVSSEGGAWTAVASAERLFSSKNLYYQLVVNEDRLFAVNGDLETMASTDGKEWNRIGEGQSGRRTGFEALSHSGRIWVIGGYYRPALKQGVYDELDAPDVLRLDPDTGRWTSLIPVWLPRSEYTPASFGNRLWVLGGISWNEAITVEGWSSRPHPLKVHHKDIWASADGEHWQQVTRAAPWGPSDDLSALVFRDRLWVICGGHRPSVWSSENGEQWTRVAEKVPWSYYAKKPTERALVASFEGSFWVFNRPGSTGSCWQSQDGAAWHGFGPHAPPDPVIAGIVPGIRVIPPHPLLASLDEWRDFRESGTRTAKEEDRFLRDEIAWLKNYAGDEVAEDFAAVCNSGEGVTVLEIKKDPDTYRKEATLVVVTRLRPEVVFRLQLAPGQVKQGFKLMSLAEDPPAAFLRDEASGKMLMPASR